MVKPRMTPVRAFASTGFLSTQRSSLPIHSSKGSWERRERFLPRAVGRMPCADG